MWEKVVGIFKTAESFLRTDKAPPGTPSQYMDEARKTTFLASKKFFVVFMSVLIISLYFSAGTVVLFMTAPFPTLTPAFVTMFTEVLKIFAIIIGSFLGLQTTLDWKMSSNSTIDSLNNTENVTITRTEHIIEEGTPGAPEIRPFSSSAWEEE